MSDYDIDISVDDAPADAATVEEAPESPAEPQAGFHDGDQEAEWAPPASQAELEQLLQERHAQGYYEALTAAQGGYEPEPAGYEPEQYAEYAPPEQPEWLAEDPELRDGIQSMIQQGIEQGIAEHLGAYQPILDAQAERMGAELAESYLTNIEQNIGEFDHQHAHAIATGLAEAGAEPAAALYQAALMVREREQALIQRGHEQYKQSLAQGQQASAQPGVSGAAIPAEELGDYDDIASSFVANGRRPTHVAG